jgi:hypothetical protein
MKDVQGTENRMNGQQDQGCQIFLETIYQNSGKCTRLALNYQMTIKYTKWPLYIANSHKIYQPFPFQGPPKWTQIGIFGLKKYHLATLNRTQMALFPRFEFPRKKLKFNKNRNDFLHFFSSRVAGFFFVKHTRTGKNMPSYHKLSQMAV